MFVLFTSGHSLALETDNYLTWDISLEDSGKNINHYINQKIDAVLAESEGMTCEEVTFAIAKKFRVIHPEKHPMEVWLKENFGPELVYPKEEGYIEQSIYLHSFRAYIPVFKLSPNVQVNGIYFGTDKLLHFSSTGRRYLDHYQNRIKKGDTEEEAIQSAIRFGISNETSILGTGLTGVYSYGDLDANYQGFTFYRRMCSTKKSYLKEEDGRWVKVEAPKIQDYVNPNWDETFNLSYYVPSYWEKVAPILKEKYCEKRSLPSVVERHNFYRQILKPSYSALYLDLLKKMNSELTPNPQSIKGLCAD